jgi:hypothetical protein
MTTLKTALRIRWGVEGHASGAEAPTYVDLMARLKMALKKSKSRKTSLDGLKPHS